MQVKIHIREKIIDIYFNPYMEFPWEKIDSIESYDELVVFWSNEKKFKNFINFLNDFYVKYKKRKKEQTINFKNFTYKMKKE